MTTEPAGLTLAENGPPVVASLDGEVAAALLASQLVKVEPRGNGQYMLVPGLRVGAVRVGVGDAALEVRVVPKVGIARLVFMLGYTKDPRWRDDDVKVKPEDDLLSAVLDALSRSASRALGYGILQGYRVVDDALPLIRGRMLAGRQLTRRFAMPLPVEVRHDEYDADIAENQILLAACHLGLRVPRLRSDARERLLHLIARLDGISILVPGSQRPDWRAGRLNDRYVGALRLAELVLDNLSFERGAGLSAVGFVVPMWKVFEDFVTIALTEALISAPGVTHCQHPVDLDSHGLVPMNADLVHTLSTKPVLVVDAKYKAERFDGYPNADAYQLLAYCTALGLKRGHLVYAKGNEERREYDIPRAGIRIFVHTLDLEGTPAELLQRIALLATDLTQKEISPP